MIEDYTMPPSNDRRQHEDHWAECWAGPLSSYLNAEHVRTSRWPKDVPHVNFHVPNSDGSETTTWGEITDAQLLRVDRKLTKYRDLVNEQGRGHLLVVLSGPLTTRTTRIEAERRILAHLCEDDEPDLHSFQSVWVAYRLPYTTQEEQEDLQHVFCDPKNPQKFKFIKHIWTSAVSVEHDHRAAPPKV